MQQKKKKKQGVSDSDMYGKNVRIPLNEFNIIKSYTDEHNYKIGGFIATAAIEKIKTEKAKNE